MLPKAIVCVTNDLATDQRVHKTCTTLRKCGYRVIETGRLLPGSLPLDRDYVTRRKKHFFNAGALFYAEYNIRLFIFLLTTKFSLVFANDLDTLPAAFLAAKIKRKRIIYDAHEYFTEVPEIIHRPVIHTIWKAIERLIFPHLTDIITVNDSIAELYKKKYGKQLVVVRNIARTFVPEKIKTRRELGLPEDKRIIILQGTGINIHRGAEEAVMSMKYLDGCVLLIIGKGDVFPVLYQLIEDNLLNSKIMIKNKMTFEELRQYTINADLGLAIDKDTNLNYRFSLPNKIFDYIHSGIPTLATELPELKRIISGYDVGYFIPDHNPQHIAEKMEAIFSDKNGYEKKKNNTRTAKAELCWENEEMKLIALIQKEANNSKT